MRRSDKALQESMRHANYLITFDREIEQEIYGNATPVLHMPVAGDDSGFSHVHRGEQFTVVASGPLRPESGFDLCIRSFARYYHQLPKNEQMRARLIIVGDGPLSAYLHGLTAEMEITSAVQFIPWLHATDQRILYAKASVFLNCAHQGRCDQLSMALSCGLPVVCFKDGVCGDYIGSDSGMTVQKGRYDTTVTRFSESLRLMHMNPSLHARLAEGARKLFAQQFTWEAKGQKLNSIYRQIASQPS
jgi:glycosyltransferase involved in cell wall biosynthesis